MHQSVTGCAWSVRDVCETFCRGPKTSGFKPNRTCLPDQVVLLVMADSACLVGFGPILGPARLQVSRFLLAETDDSKWLEMAVSRSWAIGRRASRCVAGLRDVCGHAEKRLRIVCGEPVRDRVCGSDEQDVLDGLACGGYVLMAESGHRPRLVNATITSIEYWERTASRGPPWTSDDSSAGT